MEQENHNKRIMHGKRGIVMGVANDRSIAWGIAKCLHEEGASMYLTYQNDSIKKRVEPLSQKINCLGIMPCDVSDTASLDRPAGAAFMGESLQSGWFTTSPSKLQ